MTLPTATKAALAGLALLAAAASPAAAAAPTQKSNIKLDIPYNAAGIPALPFWTAIEVGAFKNYGIDISTEFSAQSPAIVASMLSGETPFALAGENAAITADLNGGDIVLIVAGPNKLYFTIEAQPAIKTVQDLKGKTVGVTAFGTTTEFLARYVLSKAGIDPQKGATLLPMGTQANMLAALRAGQIDSAVLGSDVTLRADEVAGFNPVAPLTEYDLLFYTGGILAKQSWIKTHPADTYNVVRAYLAGIVALRTQKPAALAALTKYTGAQDPKVLEAAYQLVMRTLPKSQVPLTAAIQTGLDSLNLPAARTADPKRFIDTSYVEELVRDGFVASLDKQ